MEYLLPVIKPKSVGSVKEVYTSKVLVSGLDIHLGGYCTVINNRGDGVVVKVVGLTSDGVVGCPLGEFHNVSRGDLVKTGFLNDSLLFNAGSDILGRIVDSYGNDFSDKDFKSNRLIELDLTQINPVDRSEMTDIFDTGNRALNFFTTIAKGQRIGVLAPPGAGKTTLIQNITQKSTYDVAVLCLVGERGREITEFKKYLGDVKNTVVVASPADDSPILKLQAVEYGISLARDFAKSGKNVLFVMDSLTRFANALREINSIIGISLGEIRGYPPYVYDKISEVLEKLGNCSNSGSITSIITVLTEAEIENDPISECAISILDGHIFLDRKLANIGVYPAVNILTSISRLMVNVVPPEHYKLYNFIKEIYGEYIKNEDMINMGLYKSGTNEKIDLAIKMVPKMFDFIKQSNEVAESYKSSLKLATEILND